MKAIITVGASGGGKSTYAKELCKDSNWVNIERDVIREFIMTTQFHYPSTGNFVMSDNLYKHWKFKNESLVNVEFDLNLLRAVNNKFNIIISDTNINKDRRDALKLKLEALGYEVEIKVFGLDLTFEELCKRDLWRKNSVGQQIIWKQWKQINAEFGVKPIKFDATLPKGFLVDLDGTLCMNTSGRSAYDWHRVKEDTLNMVVGDIIDGIADWRNGQMPIFMSGRDSICRQDTIDWLVDNTYFTRGWIDDNLYMRVEGDMRPDTIVKEELIKNHLVDKYNIIFALDDRKKVIRHYNLLGIYVIDCGTPMDEF